MKRQQFLLAGIILSAALIAACQPQPDIPPTPTATPRAIPTDPIVSSGGSESPAEPTAEFTPTPLPPSGPTNFPANINPLTGLPVDDPAALNRRPIIIKVNNNPEIVRPQAGLQEADHVWEHQVEGWGLTRFSVIVYGTSPERVGSVRSGRQVDLEMVPMYQALYTASGFSSNRHNKEEPWRMFEYMLNAPWWGRNFSADFGYGDPINVRVPMGSLASEHTLFAFPEELWKLATEKGVNDRPTLDGFRFDVAPPGGGIPTEAFTIDYAGSGPKVDWKYDPASGEWLRWTDDVPHGDQLTSAQVHFDNVVIVWAWHWDTDWPEDSATGLLGVGVDLFGEGDAVLFRDGTRYDITWRRDTTLSENMIQFFDPAGNVIAFKPGNTWFQLASSNQNNGKPAVTYAP